MIEWNKISKEDDEMVFTIVDRALRIWPEKFNRLTLSMDITAVHIAEKINLSKLVGSPVEDFLHDLSGITRHVDRNTGKLRDAFWPRCGGAQ